MDFTGEYLEFYNTCLAELKGRIDYTDAYLPILDRYVLITMKAAKVGGEIADEEVTVQHTNKAKATNSASNPKLRMFFELNNQAAKLAAQLRLDSASAPPQSHRKVTEESEFKLTKSA